MTPEEALNNLDQVAAQFQGTRNEHVLLQSSIAVLKKVVDQASEDKSDTPELPNDPA